MTVVTVKINEIEYNLKGEENEEYLHKVARYVDKKIKNIKENNPKLSTTSAGVLTAINAIDEMMKSEERNKKVQDENLKLKEEIEKLKAKMSNTDSEKSQKEIVKLNEELDIIQKTAKEYMQEIKTIKATNKELKFQLQTSKYKVLDLQNKLLENQIDLAKIKKQSENPLLKKSKA